MIYYSDPVHTIHSIDNRASYVYRGKVLYMMFLLEFIAHHTDSVSMTRICQWCSIMVLRLLTLRRSLYPYLDKRSTQMLCHVPTTRYKL